MEHSGSPDVQALNPSGVQSCVAIVALLFGISYGMKI